MVCARDSKSRIAKHHNSMRHLQMNISYNELPTLLLTILCIGIIIILVTSGAVHLMGI